MNYTTNKEAEPLLEPEAKPERNAKVAICSKDLLGSTSNNKIGGFRHDRDVENGKEEWLTPPEIVAAFGPFDLDPCSPINRRKLSDKLPRSHKVENFFKPF